MKEKNLAVKCPKVIIHFIYLLKGELKIGNQDHEKTGNSTFNILERGSKLITAKLKKPLNFYLLQVNL